jgi:GntR family transcriptional regulator/MocR family aminotransferase
MALHALIDVSRASAVPLTVQIQWRIRKEIGAGVLHPGTRLPSSRRLAEDLGVSRSVVVEAYGQLIAEGYLEAVQGSGTRVVPHAAQGTTSATLSDDGHVPAVRWDLRPGAVGTANFPHREWLSSYQSAVQTAGRRGLDYPPLSGVAELRLELARYLGRVHGVRTTPDHVMVVSGFAQALGLLCAVLPRLGIDRLGLETPSHHRQRTFVREAGLMPCAVPVDEHGIDVTALARTGVRAVLVTPSHQFPTGVTLGPERRAALVRWAEDVDGWVIEDDYDGDLWLAHGPRPGALQHLAPERVVYAGTASKSLAPGLRLGWMAVPGPLVAPLERARAQRDLGSETLTQLTFADLLRTGLFDRHLRRERSRLRGRRDTLEQAVRRYLPEARIAGSPGGPHAWLRLPRQVDEGSLIAAALRRSVLVRGGRRYSDPSWPTGPALVLGYAAPPRSGIVEAVRELGAAYADVRGGGWSLRASAGAG